MDLKQQNDTARLTQLKKELKWWLDHFCVGGGKHEAGIDSAVAEAILRYIQEDIDTIKYESQLD